MPAVGTGPAGTAQLVVGWMPGTVPEVLGSPVGIVAGWQLGTEPALRLPAGTGAGPDTGLVLSDWLAGMRSS